MRVAVMTLAAALLFGCGQSAQTPPTAFDPLPYVNPLIGTDGKGKTYPGATVPHGMVQLSPDNGRTGWDWIAGYFYPDNLIAGFSHTHLSGTGAGDLYDISFMPLTRPFARQPTEGGPNGGTIVSAFSHQQEQAKAGYYQVLLQDYGINVELTAGPRSGLQRYSFPADSKTGVVRLDLGYSRNWDKTTATYVQVIDPYHIAGYRKSTGWAKDQRVYFYSQLSQPINSHQIMADAKTLSVAEASGVDIALEMDFALNGQPLLLQTAISSVSIDNAKANLLAEPALLNFDALRADAEQRWRQELSRIQVEASDDNKTQFYTAMYHSALAPRLYSDVDGRYKGPDGEIHQSKDQPRYEFFSLWDTFRALHPWLTLVKPKQNADMLQSLLAHYREAGRLPVWSFEGNETDMMLGYHSVPVLVDAYLKGQIQLDPQELLQAALHSARQQEFGLASYQQLGYVPFEERNWNVALTMEYAFDDSAIARLAQAIGQPQVAAEFEQRALNYRRHFDPASGFMRAKNQQGQFRLPFDPNAYHPEDYCEANAWQYNFFVPHDISGMIELMGGQHAVAAKLDAMFSTEQKPGELPEWISGYIGQYVHGNEPSHHVPYLYQYLGQGHKTQLLVRRIMKELYHTAPDGLAGNEDAGQMSAWYLFSALGFYPVDPVSGQYVLGSPEVTSAVVQLVNGKQLRISTVDQADSHPYVKAVYWNNQRLTHFMLSHQQLMQGGELKFEMSATP
ncbi:GH92 family glycosyl hydrolase [Rheinheimera marina]|uniref:GH92 family glycosyl hydrolase n=1 Tax=Rheinheimera marina TaxID=1774958 RepID=A0ABV9JJH0_9GAMM